MTVSEFFTMLAYTLTILVVATVVGVYFGAFFAVVFGVGSWVGGVCICALIDCLRLSLPPDSPVCRRGKCKDNKDDYEVVSLTKKGTIMRCRCGDQYLVSGRRFLEVLPDGSTRPYLKRKLFRGWKRERGKDGQAGNNE